MKYRYAAVALLAGMLFGSSIAGVAAVCTISNTGTAFGAYDPFAGTPRDTIGTVMIVCTGTAGETVQYSIALNPSKPKGNFATMTNGKTTLYYLLYSDSGYTTLWGDGTGFTSVVSDSYTMTKTRTTKSYSVYGRIPAQQAQATKGGYADTVTVTLNY